MKLSILGCYSATPRIIAHTTSQVLETRGHLFLIDCGEGTQVELRRHKIKFNQIKHVFISHLHSDHINGLEFLSGFCKVKRVFMPLLTENEKILLLIQNQINQNNLTPENRGLIFRASDFYCRLFYIGLEALVFHGFRIGCWFFL